MNAFDKIFKAQERIVDTQKLEDRELELRIAGLLESSDFSRKGGFGGLTTILSEWATRIVCYGSQVVCSYKVRDGMVTIYKDREELGPFDEAAALSALCRLISAHHRRANAA